MRIFHVVAPAFAFYFFLRWLQREPKFDWQPSAPISNYPLCPSGTVEAHVLFGGTGLLGGYIVDTWKREFKQVCLINYSRHRCEKCDINILGDVRDTSHIRRLFSHFSSQKSQQKITSVILAIKPALTGTSWKTFMEVNVAAVVEITKLAKEFSSGLTSKAPFQVLYVSSIAAASHFIPHNLAKEEETIPPYTDYQAPYDLSKRLAEDFVLEQNDPDKFRTIALRVSGIMGGAGDPFFNHRMFPFVPSFHSPVIVDYGFALNIADALAEVSKVLRQDTAPARMASGEFYYYTGEHISEGVVADRLVELTGRPLLYIPYPMLEVFFKFWQWFRWDHSTYSLIDLMRCADVVQTFDQSKFHATFPGFKPKYTVLEALEYLYGGKTSK